MLICDQIINEEGTNKKSLIGVFERVNSPIFPLAIPRLAVYVKLVDAVGQYQFLLRLVNLKDESLMVDVGIGAKIGDMSHQAELALNLGNLPIPEPGKYEFQLYCDDTFLHRATIEACKIQMPGGGPWQQQQYRRQ